MHSAPDGRLARFDIAKRILLLLILFFAIGAYGTPMASILTRSAEDGGLNFEPAKVAIINGVAVCIGSFAALLIVPVLDGWRFGWRQQLIVLSLLNAGGVAAMAHFLGHVAPRIEGRSASTFIVTLILATLSGLNTILVAQACAYTLEAVGGTANKFFPLRAWGTIGFASTAMLGFFTPTATSLIPFWVAAVAFVALAAVSSTISNAHTERPVDELPSFPNLDGWSAALLLVLAAVMSLVAAPYGALANAFLGLLPDLHKPTVYQVTVGVVIEAVTLFVMGRFGGAGSLRLYLVCGPIGWFTLHSGFALSAWTTKPGWAIAGLLGQGSNCGCGIVITLLAKQKFTNGSGGLAMTLYTAVQSVGTLVGVLVVVVAGPAKNEALLGWTPLWLSGAVVGLLAVLLVSFIRFSGPGSSTARSNRDASVRSRGERLIGGGHEPECI